MPGGRPKGYAKTGGRTKGTKNWSTMAIREKLASLNCDPLEGMEKIATDEKNDISIRLQAYKELAKYVYPQLKAIEISGPGGSPLELLARLASASAIHDARRN